jgi:GNAT superfamily N-acetyltransferase
VARRARTDRAVGRHAFSERPGIRERVHGFRIGGGLYIAERDRVPVGVLVVGPAPAYAPPVPVPELYVILLLSARQSAGQGIGARLVNQAAELGYERGAAILRIDCWAHAPGLVRWYEKQGFVRSRRQDAQRRFSLRRILQHCARGPDCRPRSETVVGSMGLVADSPPLSPRGGPNPAAPPRCRGGRPGGLGARVARTPVMS